VDWKPKEARSLDKKHNTEVVS